MTGIGAIATNPAISALIAAALYLATYLSFLRLLRYPRNWNPPTLPASLATAGLAALMVAQVSVSPDGIDLAALVLSAAFVAVLFGIIAAPAIDFRPANRPGLRPVIGFLAKHGDYAGLGMLGPALAAGYAVPNVRLQGVLAAALALEMAWYLRARWTGRRRLYRLGDHDLQVLKAQAKGDLAGFAKRHGIRELVLSGGAVGWLGCTLAASASIPRPAAASTCSIFATLSPAGLATWGRSTGSTAAPCWERCARAAGCWPGKTTSTSRFCSTAI